MLIVGQDPDWQQRSQQRVVDAMNLFLNIQERKRTDRENERQRHMALLAEHPELADGEYGTKLLKKYGGDDPLSSMVMTIRNRETLAHQSFEHGAMPFAQAIGDETGRRAGERDALAKMDDTVPTFGNAGPGLFHFLPVPTPNEEKQRRAAELEQAPDVTQAAFERLTPEQRTAYLTWQAQNPKADLTGGVKFEKGFDRTQLPADQQALRAIGAPVADQRTAARGATGLEQTPAALEKAKQEAAEKAKAEADKRAYQEKKDTEKAIAKQIEEKRKSAETWALHNDTQAHQDQMAEDAYSRKTKGKKETPWKPRERAATQTTLGARMQQQVIDGGMGVPIKTQTGLRAIAMNVLDQGPGAAGGEQTFDKVLAGYQAIQKARPKWTPSQIVDALEKQYNQQLGGK